MSLPIQSNYYSLQDGHAIRYVIGVLTQPGYLYNKEKGSSALSTILYLNFPYHIYPATPGNPAIPGQNANFYFQVGKIYTYGDNYNNRYKVDYTLRIVSGNEVNTESLLLCFVNTEKPTDENSNPIYFFSVTVAEVMYSYIKRLPRDPITDTKYALIQWGRKLIFFRFEFIQDRASILNLQPHIIPNIDYMNIEYKHYANGNGIYYLFDIIDNEHDIAKYMYYYREVATGTVER